MSEGPGISGSQLHILSCVYIMHFEDSCFEQERKLSETMGLGKRKPRLKADAVPTLFEKPVSSKRKTPTAAPQPQKKRRCAYEKRERSRVSKDFVRFMVFFEL